MGFGSALLEEEIGLTRSREDTKGFRSAAQPRALDTAPRKRRLKI
jgi:hypothetical protein